MTPWWIVNKEISYLCPLTAMWAWQLPSRSHRSRNSFTPTWSYLSFRKNLAKKLNREIRRLARRFTLPASRVYTARSGRVFDRNSARDWGKRTISWPDKGFDPYSGSVICQNLEMGCGKETAFGIEMTEVLKAMQIIVKKVAWNAESSSPSRPSLQRPTSPIPAMRKVSPVSFVSQSNQFLEL